MYSFRLLKNKTYTSNEPKNKTIKLVLYALLAMYVYVTVCMCVYVCVFVVCMCVWAPDAINN